MTNRTEEKREGEKMKTIIAYKDFTNTEAFEKWQIENPNIRLSQITPMIDSMRQEQITDLEIGIYNEYAVFVTYFKEVKDGQ